MGRKTKNLKLWCHDNNRDDLISEWDVEKNMSMRIPMQISEVEYNTPISAYWKCPKGHEWKSPIVARSIFKRSCPICNPEMAFLPIGTKYGCLTIIGGFEEYEEKIAKKEISRLEQDKEDFLQGIRKSWSNIDSVEYFEHWINDYKTRKYYKCQCKCGQVQYLDEFHFLEKRHRYCTDVKNHNFIIQQAYYPTCHECGLRKNQREKLLDSYKRVYDQSYNIEYSNTIHESLEILECVDDNYEELYSWSDKRKKGGGTYKIYKLYKCRCYLCGKEQIIKSSKFSINPPTEYGYRAYGGYYSEAYCDCHEISSFQWIVTKILTDNKVPYRVEFSFPDLYGVGHSNLLRYDFAILNEDRSIKCLIECQGEQHYKPIDEFGGKTQFDIQKRNDSLKRMYAEEKSIPLYEISYKNKKYEKVEAFLKLKDII